ncbi:cytochrome b5 domain-containing protein [Clostridium sp. UBA6640]|uniref:cytochrome b5 domain-containing protein n=1 Tax=Clostridium sp. UBA6640 TaxID=1946370 RepID=UPI0025C714D7|nr:cytochrome b5 domain-containing protein [Clostridium sp. UBA6640]
MNLETYIKNMYLYFTEINKDISLFQWNCMDHLAYSLNYRENRVFTIEELKLYDGTKGKPAYIAVDGVVYDVSYEATWGGGTHYGVMAGNDVSEEYKNCHKENPVINKLNKVGVLQK